MNYINAVGLIGTLILLFGAAWPPAKKKHVKQWLFITGNAVMLIYALANYLSSGGLFFFILLQILVNVGGWLGLTGLKQSLKNGLVGFLGFLMVVWALRIFEDKQTIFFILGLTLLAIGYTLNLGKTKQLLLSLGAGLVAYFSYVVWEPVFFVLNTFFALFSAYYYLKSPR